MFRWALFRAIIGLFHSMAVSNLKNRDWNCGMSLAASQMNRSSSMSDVMLRARENGAKKQDLSYGDVIKTCKSLCAQRAAMTQQKQARAGI
jgi:hypothetical protein